MSFTLTSFVIRCRQKNMEMAATALVAAALEDKEESEGSDTENEG